MPEYESKHARRDARRHAKTALMKSRIRELDKKAKRHERLLKRQVNINEQQEARIKEQDERIEKLEGSVGRRGERSGGGRAGLTNSQMTSPTPTCSKKLPSSPLSSLVSPQSFTNQFTELVLTKTTGNRTSRRIVMTDCVRRSATSPNLACGLSTRCVFSLSP